MSKVATEHLFRLIKSLSKSEKRQFKLISSRISSGDSKKFVALFSVLDSLSMYDESKILKKVPAISKQQLPNQKAHLYDQILRTLRFSQSEREIRQRITAQIENAHILYNKCLYTDALAIIEKAKKKATESERHELLLELLQLEKKAQRQAMKQNIEHQTNTLIRETTDAAKSIQNINIFSNLSLKLNSYYQKQGFIKNKNDLLQIQNYFNKNIPVYVEKNLSPNEQNYLFAALTGFYLFIHDFKRAYEIANKWVHIFEKDPNAKSNHPEMYIKSLNTLLVTQNKLSRYTDFMETHRKLVAVKRDKKIYLTPNLNLNLFKTIYLHEINRHFMLGEFKSGTKIVARLEREINTIIHLLDQNTILIFHYKIACLYFGSSNFKTALKWLNLIVNEQDTDLREDLHAFARILRLICYYELGDTEMIDMNIRATYRFLLKKKEFGKYESFILQFFRDTQNAFTKKEVIERFKLLKIQMLRIEKDKYERRAFNYFDIISYLESKIAGKPIEEIIQNKMKARSLNPKGTET